ncbi:Fungal specific transcription factor domain containing protein [Pleurostoma richardsiae]|uniref:Fungal specific transcription factor domain containing protein n=1 Tax=Pleurostoma richardsiae TaxID=41990 RepID=A0AA38VTY7_9PEZI|nr:Fungal specific transcription factor domain containing protein [Pleurostoma richardsiae]
MDNSRDIALQLAGSGRRSSKVCARCKKRKTKCDAGYPSCSACVKAGAVCRGEASGSHELPRSLVRALEDEVADLERRVDELQHSPSNAATALTSKLARGTLLSDAGTPQPFFLSPFSPSFFLRPSCPPLLPTRASPSRSGGHREPRPSPTPSTGRTNLGRIPSAALETMVSNYANIHLPQYPCIQEHWLRHVLAKVLSAHDGDTDRVLTKGIPPESGLTHFDYFVVFIVLAMSSLTLTWKNESQARMASDAFFSTSLQHLRLASRVTGIQRLQICCLLGHYGNLNPAKVDNWMCIWTASRVMLELGLNRQSSAETLQGEGEDEAKLRNQLLHVTLGIERSLSTILRLPLAIPQECGTVPRDADAEKNTKYKSAIHLYRLRALETEIHRILWLQEEVAEDADSDFDEWFVDVNRRLEEWLEGSEQFQKYQMLEFRFVNYGYLKARLYRPTPRLGTRTPEDRETCFDACTLLVEDYQRQIRRRRLFYPWHGVHILFEAAVVMIEACWSLRDHEPLRQRARHILSVLVPDTLLLLEKLSESWPDVGVCLDTLRPVLDHVTRAFSDRMLADIELGRQASEIATTAKLRSLLFPDGPVVWSARVPSAPSVSLDSNAHNAGDNATLSLDELGEMDWDAYWDYVQELSPLWDESMRTWP